MDNSVLGIISYLFAFTWGICILFSLIGWGGVLNRLLFPKQRVDWGQRAAWGIAFSVVVGGVLNVTWTISRVVILIYLGLGFTYLIIDFYKNRYLFRTPLFQYVRDCRKDKVLFLGSIIVVLLILLQYAGSIATDNFNGHDDYHAYFVFPNQMLQMGSMSPDPFSARRNVSLGGKPFLDTFVLSTLSEENLNIIDSGVGSIVAVGLLLSFFQGKEISKIIAIFILLLFLQIDFNQVNITAVTVPLALFLSLFRFLNWERLRLNHFLANACIIALTAAAICALKSNLIIPCMILFSLSYLFYIVDSKFEKKSVDEFLFSTGLFIAFILPWMLSMYQSSGTFLYPLLGKGYHGSVYGTLLLPYSELTILKALKIICKVVLSIDFLALCLLGFVILRQGGQKLISRESPLSLIGSAALGKILLSLAAGGYGMYRYSVSFIVPAIIILMIINLEDIRQENLINLTHSKPVIIAMFVAALLLGGPRYQCISGGALSKIKSGLKGVDLVSQPEVAQYTKMLEAIPSGETILTRLSKPFLMDFRRNRIFLADYPGEFSPPPGMPFFKGSEALADYLSSKSIRYVAYSYASEANFPFEDLQKRLSPETDTWTRTQAQHTFDFQDNLKQLGDTRKRIYDDGENFVLDLLSRKKHK
ncbi:MAG: hypothetical protein F6K47_21735 [Symploca sp. SIO2E6]|nr:hypothetical protein [Symploca sp. SIO2E6]